MCNWQDQFWSSEESSFSNDGAEEKKALKFRLKKQGESEVAYLKKVHVFFLGAHKRLV